MTERALFLVRRGSYVLCAVGVLAWLGFVASPLVLPFLPPRSFELPWSGASDFACGNDGSLYLSVDNLGSVLHYDAGGHFKASYPVDAGAHGERGLVTDGHLLYVRVAEVVVAFDEQWNEVGSWSDDKHEAVAWILGAHGPVASTNPNHASRPERVLHVGDTMFVPGHDGDQASFTCPDESLMYRIGSVIVRFDAHGRRPTVYRESLLHRLWPGRPWLVALFAPAFIEWLVALGKRRRGKGDEVALIPESVKRDAGTLSRS